MKTKTKNFNTSAKYYDFIYTKKNYKKETNFISKFFNKNIKKMKILDLGTGTGSHLVHLISKGYKVDGVGKKSEGDIRWTKNRTLYLKS